VSGIGGVLARLVDVLYARSDRSHRTRGWEVRRGSWGTRRYRLDVAAWLEMQRRADRFGSTPGQVSQVQDEAVVARRGSHQEDVA
jgi:hypothetical protein